MSKVCKLCGGEFVPRSSRQTYCNAEITRKCEVCGAEFKSTCNPSAPRVCSKSCASKGATLKEFKCEICGELFHPNSSRQKYCKKPIKRNCALCGAEFETYCGSTTQTCSESCLKKYTTQKQQQGYANQIRKCEWCGQEFTPVNNTQKYCSSTHYRKCEICGKVFEIDLTKQDKPRTCSTECATQLRFKGGNPFQDPSIKEKIKQTCLARYGVEHPMHSAEVRNRLYSRYKDKTGYSHPIHNPAIRKRILGANKMSQFERRVQSMLEQYNIEYIQHHSVTVADASHEFDFFLPKYSILVDCDGVFYHSYLSDPDGKHVLDYYDETRLSAIPEGMRFYLIVEGDEEHSIKRLVDDLKHIDSGLFNYDTELFKWCRSIEFPYPTFSTDRIKADYLRLCNRHDTEYVPTARLGDSAIQQYHRSIYTAKVGNHPSPVEAWYDDFLLKKVIANRLIYRNDVDPFKVMKGFNISKICPRVSVFNPVLAKYLVDKYLSEFDTVFDPFSGFSGRLLGVTAAGKAYIGQDLNEVAVAESNEIIEVLALDAASVTVRNVLEDEGSYDCLLTCPPYGQKERYNNETVFKSCDEWIDECIARFHCNRYVFIVDHTTKYASHIREEIRATSHFNKVVEYVVVVEGTCH